MSPNQDVQSIKQKVDNLILLQLKISKLLLLENSQKDQISEYLKLINQNNKQEESKKKLIVSKKVNLFDEEEDQPNKTSQLQTSHTISKRDAEKSNSDDDNNLKNNLQYIKNKQVIQRGINRIKKGSAAIELFQQETDLPEEMRAGEGLQKEKAIQELEDERMKQLSKNQKKKLGVGLKSTSTDGYNERDILDGIVGNSKSKRATKDKK